MPAQIIWPKIELTQAEYVHLIILDKVFHLTLAIASTLVA